MLEGGLTKVFCEGMIEIILIAMRNKKKDFLIPHSAICILHYFYRLVTNTLKPSWESFSARINAESFVSNCPTLTR